jgi:hypothetical protein
MHRQLLCFSTVKGKQRVRVPIIVTACEEFYTSLISNNCPGKQTRFLSTLKNLAVVCFPFSSANLITFNLKEKLYLCLALFLDSVLSSSGYVPIEISKVFKFFLKEVAKYLQL